MTAVAEPPSPPAPPLSAALARLSLVQKLCLLLLALAAVALSVRLWPEWRGNPDLSHGLFMPIVFLVLLYEARGGAPCWLAPAKRFDALFFALVLGSLLALCAAGMYAASVDWSHALVNVSLTASLVLMLGASLVAFSSDAVRLVPCNWSAIVALLLWLPCAPIPPGTYTRLTVGLQLWVSENTVGVLHLLGVAAVRHGNIIELARATVGVEEACSGVRSLVSCVFAGFFFSATLVRRPWARALIIALSAPLALMMNFFRSLLLTLLANSGIDIAGTWHDATGFAVLGITAVILGGLALLLEHGEKRMAPGVAADETHVFARGSWHFPALAGGLGLAGALAIFFVLNTRPATRLDRPPPDLLALMPATAEGWEVATSTDLYQFSGTLHTDVLAQRTYTRPSAKGVEQITIYVAYWRAGQAPVSLVASHTPDGCWPGSGWNLVASARLTQPIVTSGRTLPEPANRFFNNNQLTQFVWFWHIYDGQPITFRDPYSPVELLRLAWRYGFRHDGDQLFVRVSSNLPLATAVTEPLLVQFFSRTQPLGL